MNYQKVKYMNIKKELNKFTKVVIEMSIENFNLHEWEKEKFDALILYKAEKKGVKEGIQEGKKETVIEMLKNNISK